MNEDDADFLPLSGLKHFCFCRRRWALIQIEQQWMENALTLDGHYLHERVHDEEFTEKRGAVVLSRGMAVRSQNMRITGVCDLVELTRDEQGIPIYGREGRWRVYPVEYKRGRPDPTGADEWQLCAQAICLEEMLVTHIPRAAIYYAETRRRKEIELTEALRAEVRAAAEEMHRLFERGHTPQARKKKACAGCSLLDICEPQWNTGAAATEYVDKTLSEETI